MPIVRNTKGHEQVHVSNISDVTITTDGLEALQTAGNASLSSIDGKIPAALTGSGNLKVCIQELGNEGSERLNVDVGDDITQLPTALTGSGNLKVSIQEVFNTGINIKGNDGNDGAGTDREIKCDANGTVFTHDAVNTTNQTNGNQKTQVINKQDIISFIPSPHWVSGAFSDVFDVRSASKIRIYGNVQTTDTLQIQYASSVDGGGVYDWIFATETVPITTIDGSICIDFVIDCPPPYIRLKNNSASNQTTSLRVVKH